MPRKALLCERGEGCPGTVILTQNEHGEICIIEKHESFEETRVFPCTLHSLQDASLGAKTHFASRDGTCEILPTSKRVVIGVGEPGGTKAYYFVPREHFKDIVDQFDHARQNRAYVS